MAGISSRLQSGRARHGILTLVMLSLVVAVLPAGATAKPVKSKVSVSIAGIIDARASVVYVYSGEVLAEDLTFGCMEGRRVVLYRIDPKGGHHRVTHTESKFFGKFFGTIDKRLQAIPGYYFAKVKPRIRHTRKGKLRCLADRSPAFSVDVPGGLLVSPTLLAPP